MSESSSPITNVANAATAAAALEGRGFVFNIPKSLPSPEDLEFSEQWDKFAQAAQEMVHDPNSQYCAVPCDEAKTLFLDVFKTKYDKEFRFRKALFSALMKSLGTLTTQTSHASGAPKSKTKIMPVTQFRLRSSCVGFAEELKRDKLKFHSKYGISKSSIPDIACVIDADGVVDTMAVIELKLHDRGCKEFVPKRSLDLEKDHGPVGQALIYTQDTWHSIARRGGFCPEDAASTTLPDVVFNDYRWIGCYQEEWREGT
jgi:hypothetical protein